MSPARRAVFFVIVVALPPTFLLVGNHLPQQVTVSGSLQDITQAGIPHATITINAAGKDQPIATFQTRRGGRVSILFPQGPSTRTIDGPF
jgi:hypothetical protein